MVPALEKLELAETSGETNSLDLQTETLELYQRLYGNWSGIVFTDRHTAQYSCLHKSSVRHEPQHQVS